ncbi:hypothetical protein BKA16_001717 [Gordonia humi]|uniref:Uncharacterized protein n=1 Tax=Gordonia humi TaxID=686429 RepID=A0A840EQQ4_9ACTN|nr:hypothetical protein [Gordonia humi]
MCLVERPTDPEGAAGRSGLPARYRDQEYTVTRAVAAT